MFIENTKNTSMKYVEYMVYAMVAIFPFFIFKNFLYQGSSSRFLLLSLVSSICAIIVGIIFLKNKSDVSISKSPILYVFACYFVYLFVSAFFGIDFTTSFWSHSERTSGLFYMTHLVPFLFCLVYILTQKESRERFLRVFLVSSALYSFLALLGHQGFKILFKDNPFDGFLFGNSSFAAMYLLSAFLLSAYFVFRKK